MATLGKATALTAAIGLGMAYLPFGPVVLTPFVVLPLAYMAMRRGYAFVTGRGGDSRRSGVVRRRSE